MNIRQDIQDRLDELGRSRYWLAEQAGLSCRPQIIYSLLRGDRGVSLDLLEEILETLAMEVSPQIRASRRRRVRASA